MRLVCPRCNAALVPAWSGLKCPRLNACGRGGYTEALHPQPVFVPMDHVPSGVKA